MLFRSLCATAFLNDEPLHCSDPDYDEVLEEDWVDTKSRHLEADRTVVATKSIINDTGRIFVRCR